MWITFRKDTSFRFQFGHIRKNQTKPKKKKCDIFLRAAEMCLLLKCWCTLDTTIWIQTGSINLFIHLPATSFLRAPLNLYLSNFWLKFFFSRSFASQIGSTLQHCKKMRTRKNREITKINGKKRVAKHNANRRSHVTQSHPVRFCSHFHSDVL